MGVVFINYRRENSAGEARALYGDLGRLLGEDRVFMDVDNIELGHDFRDILRDRLAHCDVMLTLIGRGWADVRDGAGQRRLDQEGDFVRLEIATALERRVPVTPVLVQDARMPDATALPAEIQPLAYRNGFALRHGTWDADVREMVRRLKLRPAQRSRAPLLAGLALLVGGGAAGGWWLLWPPPEPQPMPPAAAPAAEAASAAPAVTTVAAAPSGPPAQAAASAPAPAALEQVAPEPAPAPPPAPKPAPLAEAPKPPPQSEPPKPVPEPAPLQREADTVAKAALAPAAPAPAPAGRADSATALLDRLLAPDPAAVTEAADALVQRYARDAAAIDEGVTRFTRDFGPINNANFRSGLLRYLNATDPKRWTEAQRTSASATVQRLRQAMEAGRWRPRPEVRTEFDRLAAALGA